ncbi:acylneuraminate cytidylyltransferase family protein [Candidatus Pelagibacter sp. HIMB1321]|uniref:acylneuraminate cytidylyltransferase family protein n=1 Tax=Candidatus Pelagibacter sp. HIMB1321 TaxID=1388755 RepID=UPI000A07DD49|nr:acylneuraminate cytidylyltransferase family protein [Candidatus Pelagibacter sp. HIMB1321]SMF79609.1 N-acylneuraminate cytidylyltransferase [Candidatus Pelagibacter sp. HIMB1321]
MKNLIIIPARKNSKRIKNKNLIKVLKKPLIFWTIKFAKKFSKDQFDVVVSSDSNKIQKICTQENIFFLKRPKKISGDNSSMHEVIHYVISQLETKYKYIILLQPTSPLRNFKLVHESIKILNKKKKFDSLIHLAKNFSFTGKIINNRWMPDYNLNLRTQDIRNKFVPTGNIYVYRTFLYYDKINLPKKTYGLVSETNNWIDIDTKEDLQLLEYYLEKKQKIKKSLLNLK